MTIDSSMVWVGLGFALLIAEMLTGTFTLIFIALGCFAAGLISLFPSTSNSHAVQVVCFALISMVGLILLRKPLQTKLLKSITLKSDIGKEILVDHNIQPHSTARITYQGTQWQATNLDPEELKKGDRVCIVGIDGITLLIRKVF